MSASGLAAEPNPLTIGPVLHRATEIGTVTLQNLRAEPIEVFSTRYAGGRAAYDEVVTRGAFGALPPVDLEGRVVILDPDDKLPVPVAYTAPDSPAKRWSGRCGG